MDDPDLGCQLLGGLRSVLAAAQCPGPILRARLGDVDAADSLVDVVAQPGAPAQRREAARLLLQLPARPSTISSLTRLQLDDPMLADWVSVAVFRLGHRPARQQVERILADANREFELRLRAAEALAGWQGSGAAPALLGLLQGCPDRDSCRQVIVALGRLGDRSAAAALAARLNDPGLLRESIRALGQIAGPAAVASLIACLLHHEHPLARVEAARALRSIGGPRLKYSLSHAALGDPAPMVRQAAFMALLRLARAEVGSSARQR